MLTRPKMGNTTGMLFLRILGKLRNIDIKELEMFFVLGLVIVMSQHIDFNGVFHEKGLKYPKILNIEIKAT